jgi:hypothetical protein
VPGQEPEELLPHNALAIKAWNFLSNGMGGMDAAGLPFVCEWLGFEDPELLAEALLCIRLHGAKKSDEPPDETEDLDPWH